MPKFSQVSLSERSRLFVCLFTCSQNSGHIFHSIDLKIWHDASNRLSSEPIVFGHNPMQDGGCGGHVHHFSFTGSSRKRGHLGSQFLCKCILLLIGFEKLSNTLSVPPTVLEISEIQNFKKSVQRPLFRRNRILSYIEHMLLTMFFIFCMLSRFIFANILCKKISTSG